MGLHAEIMSLRDTLGLSYKDASHRLYMAEWEKLKTDDRTQKAFALMATRARAAVGNFQTRLDQLGAQATPPSVMQNAHADPDPDTDTDGNAAPHH